MTTSHAIFLCYRRADSEDLTSKIRDKLVAVFGEDAVFQDIRDFEVGDDWQEMTGPIIRNAKAAVVVIGEKWVEIAKTRLKNKKDPIRNELLLIMKSDCAILPVKHNGTIYDENQIQVILDGQVDNELQDTLANLFKHSALELFPKADLYGITALIDKLENIRGIDRVDESPRSRIGAIIVGACLIAGLMTALLASYFFDGPVVPSKPEPPQLPQIWTEGEALSWVLANQGTAKVINSQRELIVVRTLNEIPKGEFHIDSLSLSGCTADINAAVARLRENVSLKDLDLSGTNLNDAGGNRSHPG